MSRAYLWLVLGLLAGPVWAGERVVDFSKFILNQPLPGFRSVVSGLGKPGNWQTMLDSAASASNLPPVVAPTPVGWQTMLDPAASPSPMDTNHLWSPGKRAILAQLARDPTDEHFPLLMVEGDSFGDFRLTTHFKNVAGEREQMAGIAFRIQDEKNYYLVRASSLGNTLRFYKFVDGQRTAPIGPDVPIPSGVWHELIVECRGFQIRCLLNGKELIYGSDPERSFPQGKIGFWTKSDSVAYFGDTTINYTEKESIGPALVQDQLRKYPHLQGLRIYMRSNDLAAPTIIASNDPKEVGKCGGAVEKDVISHNHLYCGIGRTVATVTLPLHDRNGESIAAVRLVVRSFPGQTEKNALGRTMPIVKEMELRVRNREELMP